METFLRLGRWSVLAAGVLVPVVALAGVGAHAWRMQAPPQSEEDLRERLDLGAHRLIGWSDATSEQQALIEATLDEAAPTLWDRHVERAARHVEFLGLLSVERVDREALEALRVEAVVSFDELSRDLVGTIADIAESLSFEQRRALLQHHDALCNLD